MRFPFLKQPDKPEEPIVISTSATVACGAYLNLHDLEIPDTPAMLRMAEAWVKKYSPDPLGTALLDYLNDEMLRWNLVPISESPPIMRTMLRLGIDEADRARLETATHFLSITGDDRIHAPRWGLHAAHAAACGVSRALDGVAFDWVRGRYFQGEETTRPFDAQGALQMDQEISVLGSRGASGTMWITTTGMPKFDFYNLQVHDVPPHLRGATGRVLRGIAHHLMEATHSMLRNQLLPELRVPREFRITYSDIRRAHGEAFTGETPRGTQGWAVIRLVEEPTDDPEDDPFLTLCPPRGVRIQHGVWLAGLASDLEGFKDEVRATKTSSENMQAAHLRAKAELPGIKNRFVNELKPGEHLHVKHGFRTPNADKEYMWIAVEQWTGKSITGSLANAPHGIPSLRAGQSVTIDESEVFDFTFRNADGTMEGGYTTRVATEEGSVADGEPL